MTAEIVIDQDVLKNELDIKRQIKIDLENEVKNLEAESLRIKKRQDILTAAKEGLRNGPDQVLIDGEITAANDKVWDLISIIKKRQSAIGYYERLIMRLEELQE